MRNFGEIPGIKPGDWFANRKDLAASGIHLPLVAGISGSQYEGADSIVLAGGYEDDEDFGDVIIYTGAGSQKNNKQISDQKFETVNKALAKNKIENIPVRVTRGHKHKNELSPTEGYRYAGLYYVDSYWSEIGKAGYLIWRYRLISVENHYVQHEVKEPESEYNKSERRETTVNRIVRDYQRAINVKQWHEYQCQVCGIIINTNAGRYAEAAHIQPLGEPHNGPDIESNLLCLCPNHHVMFDNGSFTIDDNFQLIGISGELRRVKKHAIDVKFIQYHRAHYYKNA